MREGEDNTSIIRDAWDEYHPSYMEFNLLERPDFHRFFADGGVVLDDLSIELAGDVRGKTLLDICCAGDAKQAFSWENLGADVIACDISSIAIEIARKNADKIGSKVRFHVADAQELQPIPDDCVDIVYATFIVWFEDLRKAARSWCRVLRSGGRLLLIHENPVVRCLEEDEDGARIVWNYFDRGPERYTFTGTPLADKHGGWQGKASIVEFYHTFSDIINALCDAGFRIEKMVEPQPKEDVQLRIEKLPGLFGLTARK
jgi:ubiquinone/menaquinone biosynthesis C-methylase UbiE